MEHLGAKADSVAEARGADRQDHELLKVHVVVGVRPPVDDVHHGDRERQGPVAAQMAIERHAALRGRGAGRGHRHAEDGVGSESSLAGRAVQPAHELIELGLGADLLPDERALDLAIHMRDGFLHPLAAIALGIPIAELDGLTLACGRPRGHRGDTDGPRLRHDLHLDGGIAARVQDLAAVDGLDARHARAPDCEGTKKTRFVTVRTS